MVEYCLLMNMVFWYQEVYYILVEDCVIQIVGVVFDLVVQEIWLYLIVGVVFYLLIEELRINLEVLRDWFIDL